MYLEFFRKKFLLFSEKYLVNMGISASCQPSYPQYNDFILFIRNADKFIRKDKHIMCVSEKVVLQAFFENLEYTLQNSSEYNLQLPWGSPGINWPQSKQLKEYFNRIRLIIPKSKKMSKLFTLAHSDNFFHLFPNTQCQLAQVYAVIAFLWLIFYDGNNAVKYFYRSDILHHIYGNDCKSMEVIMNILEKIYFTSKNGYIPSHCLIMPTCNFKLVKGQIKSISSEESITGPKTYHVMPDPNLINEPFYTLTPVQIEIFLTVSPIQINKSKDNQSSLDRIQEDINILIEQLKCTKKKEKEENVFGNDWKENFNDLIYTTRKQNRKEKNS